MPRKGQTRRDVPRAPLAEIVEEWLEWHRLEHSPEAGQGGWRETGSDQTGPMKALSFETGLPPRRLYEIRTGRGAPGEQFEYITTDLADRLLIGIGHPEYWQTRLAA